MLIKSIFVSILISLAAPVLAGGGSLDSVFDEYQKLQMALAGDNFDTAKAATKSLGKATMAVHADHLAKPVKMAWTTQASHLKSALKSAADAGDIDQLRQQFEHISMAVIALANKANPAGMGEYRCPMAFENKGANWLQKEGAVRNPYFGSAMLDCGSKVSHKKGHNKKPHHHKKH